MRVLVIVIFGWLASCTPALDNSVLIATASSFRPALEQLTDDLEQTCSTRIKISSASTGALVAQARQGAPFDLLISADPVLSKLLQVAVMDRPFARSPLALWMLPGDNPSGPIAIANPRTAPFGQAAMAVIAEQDIELVTGSSAAQAFSFVKSGSAVGGYVPLVLLQNAQIPTSEYEVIDPALYPPIYLQVLRLSKHPQAKCLAEAIASRRIWARLSGFGYQRP